QTIPIIKGGLTRHDHGPRGPEVDVMPIRALAQPALIQCRLEHAQPLSQRAPFAAEPLGDLARRLTTDARPCGVRHVALIRRALLRLAKPPTHRSAARTQAT